MRDTPSRLLCTGALAGVLLIPTLAYADGGEPAKSGQPTATTGVQGDAQPAAKNDAATEKTDAQPATAPLAPEKAPAPPPPPAPPPAPPVSPLARPLLITGLSVFLASYAITGAATTATVVIAHGRDATIGESWVPVAGPWIMLADSAGFDTAQMTATAVGGVLQTLSAASLITGIALTAPAPQKEARSLVIAPLVTANSGHLIIGGAF